MPANAASRLAAILPSTLMVVACTTTTAPRPEPQEDLSALGANLAVAQFRPEPMTAGAISARVSGMAALLGGPDVPSVSPQEVARAFAATPERVDLLVESAARISVHVDVSRSEILVVQGAVTDDMTSNADIGMQRARAVFEDTLAQLVSRQLVAADGLAIGRVHTGRVMQSESTRDGKASTRVKEYFFEVPRAIGGIEVFGASVTIAVHRSGKVASIREVGPLAASASTNAKRVVSAASLIERARQENAGAEVAPMGLRYPWGAVRSDTALASRARETYRIVPVTKVDDRTIHGRAYYAFYAVDDDKSPPISWPRPNPSATGDPRK